MRRLSEIITDMLLHEKLQSHRLILASHSPRRQQLLRDAGLSYLLADKYEVEENYPATLPAADVPRFLSKLKSESYPIPLESNDILITADTVVILDDRIIGKPHDRADAIATLQALSGRTHRVITGVTLRSSKQCYSFDSQTDVHFGPLSDEQIEYYIDTYKPFDKAGAYGIQEWIGYVAIQGIDGSFYNVMGLPIQKLYNELDRFIDQL